MNKMLQYMVVHVDPHIPWEKVEENWAKLANAENAIWIRTCFNKARQAFLAASKMLCPLIKTVSACL